MAEYPFQSHDQRTTQGCVFYEGRMLIFLAALPDDALPALWCVFARGILRHFPIYQRQTAPKMQFVPRTQRPVIDALRVSSGRNLKYCRNISMCITVKCILYTILWL
jgi:hypothetical protein